MPPVGSGPRSSPTPAIGCLAPWFGSNRILGENVGKLLKGCKWVGVPFAGGMAELVHINARTLLVNDLHKHIINLAMVAADPREGAALLRKLKRLPVHPETLATVQNLCTHLFERVRTSPACLSSEQRVDWAVAYFACCWMARSSEAGKDNEFKAKLAIRWEAGGGDSCKRYTSAIASLRDWRRILARATFSTLDVFEFLTKCHDKVDHGIYCDPPFPGPGGGYKHKFTHTNHEALAVGLAGYVNARIVCRFYDHPLIRKLYPETKWEWCRFEGRKQSNAAAPEVLLVNRGSQP